MARVQPKSLSLHERNELLNELWSMIATLQTREEVERFFRSLLSETEAVMFARRIRIAKFLLQGWSYERICEELHTSDTTVASVHRWLQEESSRSTELFPRLERELEKQREHKRKKETQNNPGSFEWLKNKYPLHFLLFNILDSTSPRPKRKT